MCVGKEDKWNNGNSERDYKGKFRRYLKQANSRKENKGMSTTGSICYNCFAEMEEGQKCCPNCGFDSHSQKDRYPMALPYGSVLDGRYITGRILGQGGFGITYVAQDWKTKDIVAVKEYMPDTLASRVGAITVSAYSGKREENFEYGKQCFLDEAKTLAEFIGNPNIVRVHSYFEENGTAYFVMDYVKGSCFQEYIMQRGGRISWQEAEQILVPVMDALAEIHEKGIIHRDVTPENIFITEDQTVKLLDFGAARYSWGNQSQSLDIILKHGYAPKEQYSRHGRQGPYTDIYALAACYYFSVTGRVPPDSIDRPEEYLQAPSSMGINLPVHVEDAILKGLSVQAADRFQNMRAFKAALAVEEDEKSKEEEDREEQDAREDEPKKEPKEEEYGKEQSKKEQGAEDGQIKGRGTDESFEEKKEQEDNVTKPVKKQLDDKKKIALIVGAAAVIVICCLVLIVQNRRSAKSPVSAKTNNNVKSVSDDTLPIIQEPGAAASDTMGEEEPVVRGNTAGNLNNGGIAVEDEDYLYIAVPYDGKGIEKFSKKEDAELETLLEKGDVKALNLYDNQIYYMSNGKNVSRMNKDGSGIEKLLEIEGLSNFCIVNDYLYYCLKNEKDLFDLYRMDLEGLEREKIVSDMAGKEQYLVDGGHIYYWDGEDYSFYKMDMEDEKKTLITEMLGFRPVFADDWIYFYNKDGVYRLHKDGSEQELMYADPSINYMNIYDDSILFITEKYDGEVNLCEVEIGGTKMEKLYTIKKEEGDLRAIGVLENHVIFYDLNTTTEYSVGIYTED